jgi:hypothetical protein
LTDIDGKWYAKVAFTHEQDSALLESNVSGSWGFAEGAASGDVAFFLG